MNLRKTILLFGLSVIAFEFALFGLSTNPVGTVKLAWDYPTNELGTNLWFVIRETTNIANPLTNWNVLTNVVGTNTTVQLWVQPGAHFFVATASNFWGDESTTSNIASTPPLPKSLFNSLSIQKVP